jgi:hypothetical protein
MYNSDFTKISFGPILFLDNIFDDKFLEEKESALSPIFLDDSIQSQNNNPKNLKFPKTNSKNLNKLNISVDKFFDKRKTRKRISSSYDSNIILVSSYQEDDSVECPIIKEIKKLKRDPKILTIIKHSKRKKRQGRRKEF